MIPIYVVCGFLGAGKSTLINEQLRLRQKMASTAVFAFEEGATALQNLIISFSINEIDCTNIDEVNCITIPERIANYIEQHHPKEIWIEWNGTLPFPQLESILYNPLLSENCRIERVIFVATDYHLNTLLPGMGDILRSQLYSADVVVRNQQPFPNNPNNASNNPNDVEHNISYNTDSCHFQTPTAKELHHILSKPRLPWTVYSIIAVLTAYILLATICRHDIPYEYHQVLAVTLGLILEGIPFLLLGTIVTTAIRLFMPERWILHHLQGNSCKSYALAMGSGLALPVCDCATIPMFKALLDKGVPQHIALLFMLTSPIMNPIAILATYYAFPNDESIVLWRIVLGLLVSLIVSLTFKFRPFTFTKNHNNSVNENNYIYNSVALVSTKKRLVLFHTEREFLQLLSYFSIAAFVIAMFQVWLKPLILTQNWALPIWADNILLLGFAFIFSLCSTSDAIIGRSLTNLFPLSSVLGFLILGPMMDIKNAYILNQYIGPAFTRRLAFTISIVTLITIIVFQIFSPY